MSIEIIVDHHIYLESMAQSWKSNDINFSYDHNHLEQIIFSAWSPHIEELKSKKDLNKRIISLNILVNGAIFINIEKTRHKITFSNYDVHDKSLKVEPNNGMSLWSESIEEYPFKHNEEYYQKHHEIQLPADLDSVLFGVSKINFTIRTLLFQAGLICNNSPIDKILTWNTLYKMVDTIKFGCNEIGISIFDLIEKKDLEKFTSACNNPTVLGINARHGGNGKEIKKIKPITELKEAINLILCLAKKFSQQYILYKKYVANIKNMDMSKCRHKEYEDPSKKVKEEFRKKLFKSDNITSTSTLISYPSDI